MAGPKLEVLITANAKNAIEGLKATQQQINNVGDTLAKLGNSGKLDPAQMQDAFDAYAKSIDRAAKAMAEAGQATSELEAKQKVLSQALESVLRVKGGSTSAVAQQLRTMLAETNKLIPATGKLESGWDRLGKKVFDTVKNVVQFRIVMRIVNAVVNGFLNTVKDSVRVAAEAEQTFSKLNTVFDGLATSGQKAADVAREIGVASTTAASALSTVGDLLQAQGMGTAESLETATEWVKTFQDIIAFKDIDMSLEEFAQNFMSGAAGNLRNFRTFGSIVKESAVQARLAADGLDQLTGEQLELAKMTTRATIALDQQKNASGATEREWETMLSVNRRMNEEIKRYKENLGETLNEALKPLKSAWTDIVSEMNKALEAQQALAKYKVRESGSSGLLDWVLGLFGGAENYQYEISKFAANNKIGTGNGKTPVSEDMLKGWVNIGREIYGLGDDSIVKELTEVKGLGLTETDIKNAIKAALDDERSAQENDALLVAQEKIAGRYESLLASLNALTGVSINSTNPLSEGALRNFAGADFNTALSKMKGNSLSAYADVISVALGSDTTLDSLRAQQEEYRTLYELVRNFYILNNNDHALTQDNINLLNDIKAGWQGINKQIDDYNEGLQRAKDYEAAVKGFKDTAASYGNQLADAGKVREYMAGGMGEERANAIVALERQYTEATKLTKTLAEAFKLNSEKDAALKALKAWFDDVEKLAEEEAEKARKANVSSAFGDYSGSTDDLLFSTRMLGRGELDVALQEASRDFLKLVNSLEMTNEEYDEASILYEQHVKALKDYYEAMKKLADDEEIANLWKNVGDQFTNMFGTGGRLFTAYRDMKSGEAGTAAAGKTSVLGILMDILSKTEAFQKIASFVDDTIVPILDLVLKPLLPIIENVKNIIQDMIGWLMPVWRGVVEGLGAVDLVLTMIHTAVHNVLEYVKKLVNWNYKINRITYADAKKEVEQRTAEALAGIENWTHLTANNTAKGDYATYADLRKRGMLSKADYASLIRSNNYTSSTTMGSATMTQSGYGSATYISLSGLTIKTEISNVEELEEFFADRERGLVSYTRIA